MGAHETAGGGTNYTGLSVLVPLLIFPSSAGAAETIAFGVLDSVSTIAGLRYGRRHLPNGKSVEGTLAAIVFTAPVLLFSSHRPPPSRWRPLRALAELVLPGNDNLVVPFLLALLVTAVA